MGKHTYYNNKSKTIERRSKIFSYGVQKTSGQKDFSRASGIFPIFPRSEFFESIGWTKLGKWVMVFHHGIFYERPIKPGREIPKERPSEHLSIGLSIHAFFTIFFLVSYIVAHLHAFRIYGFFFACRYIVELCENKTSDKF